MSIDSKMKATEKITMKQEKQTIKQIQVEYQKALNSIRRELADVYAKFEVDGELTLAEMSKYGRLKALEKTINIELGATNSEVNRTIFDYQVETWRTNYYGAGFALETELDRKISFALFDKTTIRKSVENPLTNLALENNSDQVKRKIRSTITQGFAQGQSVQQMTKNIKHDLEKNANNATRIVRTETNKIQNQAIQEAGERASSMGIVLQKKWNATLDGRTRDTHAELDQVKIGIDEEFTIRGLSTDRPGNFGVASEDISCRCRLTYVPKESDNPKFRRGKVDGKNKIIPYTNYNDWYENRVVNKN